MNRPNQSPPDDRNWVEVDLSAISDNVRAIAAFTGVKVLAVVKANAYGHGAPQVASAALAGGATLLGVGSAYEAMELRHAGIEGRILVMGYVPARLLDELVAASVEVAVWSDDQIDAVAAAAIRTGEIGKVHLYADVEMGRFGAPFVDIPRLFERCLADPKLQVNALMGHLPSIEEDVEATRHQINAFGRLAERIREESPVPVDIHLGSSEAIMNCPESYFDMVRAGILLYGGGSGDVDLGTRPALSWKATLLDVQFHAKGSPIGYGGEYVCPRDQYVAVVGAGYADGFRRTPKNVNSVLFQGVEVPTVGRICTQHCMIVVPEGMTARPGDEVMLLGDTLPAIEVARRWGTNQWDVFCNINVRVPRFYSKSAS